MFWQHLLFELKYRSKRPATYLYFVLVLLLGFIFAGTDIVQVIGGSSNIMDNSPFVIMVGTVIISMLGLLIISAVMGVPVFRDFDHNTYALFYTKPISKFNYLGGRLVGSYLITAFIFFGGVIGMVLGHTISPWKDAEKLLPFHLWRYIYLYLVITIPNIIAVGAIFFCTGTLSRKMMMIYMQGIAIFGLYLIASTLGNQLDNETLSSLLEPLSFEAMGQATQYWTVAEKNTLLIPLSGDFLWNRLLWLGIGVLFLAFTYFRFKLGTNDGGGLFGLGGKKKVIAPTAVTHKTWTRLELPKVNQRFDLAANWKQFTDFVKFYTSTIIKDVPFIAIAAIGLVILGINSMYVGEMYGTVVYPVTRLMTSFVAGNFSIFILIIITFYSGELVWRERGYKIDQIYDTMPVPNAVNMLSKVTALSLVILLITVFLIVFSVVVQALYGYYQFELDVYLGYYAFRFLPNIIFLIILAFFTQVMFNNKFVGYAVTIGIFLLQLFALTVWGFDHYLYQYGQTPSGSYSDMNRFGHFTTPEFWYNLYWLFFGGVLLLLTTLFTVRGKETLFWLRSRIARYQTTRQAVTLGVVMLFLFGLTGCYIFYNTNIQNTYQSSKAQEGLQANYEKQYKKYENALQPHITDVNLKVDIFPVTRDVVAEGKYLITNKHNRPIDSVHITLSNPEIGLEKLDFAGGAEQVHTNKEMQYYIYKLAKPLQPNEQSSIDFKVNFITKGFKNNGSSTNVVENGSFFNSMFMPAFGYNGDNELSDDDTRKENGLEKKNDRMPPRNDSTVLAKHFINDDADLINFEIVLSTDKDQIAIAPGYLQKEWEEGDRKFFHYKMDKPMCNFYSIVSARYEVAKDVWQPPVDTLSPVNIEIYHHAFHPYNVETMIEGVKKSMDYYTANFSPYQYRQMRIMEFPAYQSFAQSFANTVPFSEGIGFIAQVKDPLKDIDYPFYVTAHEVAHQWWGHQVAEAPVQGNAMLSETMSQYSALMVMKKEFGEEQMRKFLRYELRSYLTGRSLESKKEKPLELVEGQGYIHYRKGSVVMYALQDYIGENKVNAAYRKYLNDWRVENGKYPSTADFMPYLYEVTPDSLQYLLTDMFETITLFENKVEEATYTALDNGKYEVTMKLSAEKMRADSLGNETVIPINDWVDVGIFKEDKDDDEGDSVRFPLYLKKHKITGKETEFTFVVDTIPANVGFDPYNKLIDRHTSDNVLGVDEKEAL